MGFTVTGELIGSWRWGTCDELSPATEDILQGSMEILQSPIHSFFFSFFKSVILSLLKWNLGCGPRRCNKFCGSYVRVCFTPFELRIGWQISSVDAGWMVLGFFWDSCIRASLVRQYFFLIVFSWNSFYLEGRKGGNARPESSIRSSFQGAASGPADSVMALFNERLEKGIERQMFTTR